MIEAAKEAWSGIDIRFDELLKDYTYTKVGGKVDALAFPRNRQELGRLVRVANKYQIPWLVLGNASNLIVRDGGIRGLVIMLNKLNAVTVDGDVIEAEAGASLIETTHVARRYSLTGFEFACRIPGSVGGAVFMNAGAYGSEVAHILLSVKVMTTDGDFKTVDAADMQFGYRYSALQETGDVVVSAKFALKPGDHTLITHDMARLTYSRELKQPLSTHLAGQSSSDHPVILLDS